jgi:hypothetical protein
MLFAYKMNNIFSRQISNSFEHYLSSSRIQIDKGNDDFVSSENIIYNSYIRYCQLLNLRVSIKQSEMGNYLNLCGISQHNQLSDCYIGIKVLK